MAEKHNYIVRMRETVIAEYHIEAETEEEALQVAGTNAVTFQDRRELETVDWEVESVKRAPW